MGDCGSLRCSKLCIPLRGERQETQCVDAVAKNAEGKYIEESVDAWNIS